MLRIIEFREPLVTKLRFEGALTCEDSLEVRERVLSVTQAVPDKPVLLDLGDLHKADPCGELFAARTGCRGSQAETRTAAQRESFSRKPVPAESAPMKRERSCGVGSAASGNGSFPPRPRLRPLRSSGACDPSPGFSLRASEPLNELAS